MKRASLAIFAVLFGAAVVVATIAASGVQAAVRDLVAPLGASIADGSIDGNIGTEWSDANSYTNVPINPSGMAAVSTKHDGTFLYIAVAWVADIARPWFAIELGFTGCMDNGADGALFGNDGTAKATLGGAWTGEVGLYRDIEFSGTGLNGVNADATPHGVGAIRHLGSNAMAVELKKPLNSLDAAGNDIAWTVGNTYDLLMTWDSNGDGNPGGGSANGMSLTNSQTIQLSAVAIPEFPTAAILLVTIAGTFLLVAAAARMRRKA